MLLSWYIAVMMLFVLILSPRGRRLIRSHRDAVAIGVVLLALAAAYAIAGCSRRPDRPPAPVPTPVASPTPTPAASPVPSPGASPAPTPAPSAAWTGEVYATANLTGAVVATRTDPAPLRVTFPSASSFPQGVTARPFSIRWRGTWQIPAGTYRFTVRVDDGVRLLIDGVRVFESWKQQPPTTYTIDLTFTETALHAVVVEYQDVAGSGVLELAWAPVTPGPAPTPGPSPGASPAPSPGPTPSPQGARRPGVWVGWALSAGPTPGVYRLDAHYPDRAPGRAVFTPLATDLLAPRVIRYRVGSGAEAVCAPIRAPGAVPCLVTVPTGTTAVSIRLDPPPRHLSDFTAFAPYPVTVPVP